MAYCYDRLESIRGVRNVLFAPVLSEYLRSLKLESLLELLANEEDLTFESCVLIVPVKVETSAEVKMLVSVKVM